MHINILSTVKGDCLDKSISVLFCRASVRVRQEDLRYIMTRLNKYSTEHIYDMRKQVETQVCEQETIGI